MGNICFQSTLRNSWSQDQLPAYAIISCFLWWARADLSSMEVHFLLETVSQHHSSVGAGSHSWWVLRKILGLLLLREVVSLLLKLYTWLFLSGKWPSINLVNKDKAERTGDVSVLVAVGNLRGVADKGAERWTLRKLKNSAFSPASERLSPMPCNDACSSLLYPPTPLFPSVLKSPTMWLP